MRKGEREGKGEQTRRKRSSNNNLSIRNWRLL